MLVTSLGGHVGVQGSVERNEVSTVTIGSMSLSMPQLISTSAAATRSRAAMLQGHELREGWQLPGRFLQSPCTDRRPTFMP